MKIIRNTIWLLAMASTLIANAQQPASEMPSQFRNASAATENIGQQSWNTFFTEPDLFVLIASAVEKNNDLQIAEKNIAIANLQYRQSRWGNVPQLNASVSASTTKISENSVNGLNIRQLGQSHIDDYTAGLNLSWEADIWGKIRNRKKSAKAEYLQTSEAKKALQTAVVANVATGYYDLLMLDAQLDIAKKTLALSDSTLFIVKLQFDAGQVTSLATQQTEAQRLVAARLVPELEKDITLRENAIGVLSGHFPSAIGRKAKLETIALKENLSAGIPAQLLERRPDVKAAQYALEAANARVGIAKAQLYPSLNITASGGVNAFEVSNWFTMPASLFGSIAGGLTAPLLNGKRIRTNYEVAKQQRDQAAIAFRQTVLIAVAEVSDALVKIEKQQQQFAIAKQRSETLQAAIANANMLFKNGMATYLEVIVAQNNLLGAQLEMASIKRDRLASSVELYRALGGGWE